jgi:hypothetical protein
MRSSPSSNLHDVICKHRATNFPVFEVLTAVSMKGAVFWTVMPYNLETFSRSDRASPSSESNTEPSK